MGMPGSGTNLGLVSLMLVVDCRLATALFSHANITHAGNHHKGEHGDNMDYYHTICSRREKQEEKATDKPLGEVPFEISRVLVGNTRQFSQWVEGQT